MVSLATVTLQGALWSGQAEPWLSIVRLAAVGVVVVIGGWLLKDSRAERLISVSAASFLLGLFLLPAVTEPFSRLLLGRGNPWEILLVCSLRNIMLGLAALRHTTCQRLASVASFFVVLFAFLLDFSWLTALLCASYLVVGMWWLIGTYWEKVQGKMPQTTRRELPKRASLVAVGTVFGLVCLASLFVGRGAASRSLAGFMPSSGGNQRSGNYAWSGVGDGDQLVAAKDDAMSFGPVESDVFLDSDMSSLYDMFDEAYGGPIKPGTTERAIALALQDRPNRNGRMAVSTVGSRDFSTIRKKTQARKRELEDRESKALFYVVGRTPLHLSLDALDTFDGATWTSSDTKRFISNIELETIHDEPWIRLRSPSHSLFTEDFEPHALKIVNLKTRSIPSPPHLSRVHIDKVDRVDFFAWNDKGILEMSGRKQIPRLTVIQLRSLRIKQNAVRDLGDFTRKLPPVETPLPKDPSQWTARERLAHDIAPYRVVPPDTGSLADELGQTWTRNVPRGWPQVEVIVDHLRTGYVHDPQANAPDDCTDVVEHFLTAGRGPDYMFATSAAVMLRKLGYPTRLATGFYVRPDRYDRLARQTPVLGEDVHVWAEVCIDGKHWIPIEPTPGYEPPSEAQSWTQWAATVVASLFSWVRDHWLFIGLGLSVVVVSLIWRRAFLDCIASGTWRLLGRGSAENRIRWTIWLIDRRAHLAGNPRPRRTTLAQWYSRAGQSQSAPTQATIRSFIDATERVLYGENHPLEAVWRLCELAASRFDRRLFRDFTTGQP